MQVVRGVGTNNLLSLLQVHVTKNNTYHSTKSSPTQGKGIGKFRIDCSKGLSSNPDTFRIEDASKDNERGKDHDQDKKHDTHDAKEKEEIDPKHPVQVHGQLLIGVNPNGHISRRPRRSSNQSAGTEMQQATGSHTSTGGFQSILLFGSIFAAGFYIVSAIGRSGWIFGALAEKAAANVPGFAAETLAPGHRTNFGFTADLTIIIIIIKGSTSRICVRFCRYGAWIDTPVSDQYVAGQHK